MTDPTHDRTEVHDRTDLHDRTDSQNRTGLHDGTGLHEPTELHIRAVRRTSHRDEWRLIVEALGARPAAVVPGAVVPGAVVPGAVSEESFALAAGHLVLRSTPESSEIPVTAIELGTSDAATPSTITGPDGMSVTVVPVASSSHRGRVAAPAEPRPSTTGVDVNVCPLWTTPCVPEVVEALRGAGLVPRLSSNAGQWVDLRAPGGGLVAVHLDEWPHAVLAFESANLEALAVRFSDRGLRADIVDESYGRSLRFDDPDGGVELWVNETMTDRYGYQRSEP